MKILWCKKEAEQAIRIASHNCEKLNIDLKPDLEELIAYLPYADHNSFFMGILVNFVKREENVFQVYFYVPARVATDENDLDLMQSTFSDGVPMSVTRH